MSRQAAATNADQVRKCQQKKRESGLVPMTIWVPEGVRRNIQLWALVNQSTISLLAGSSLATQFREPPTDKKLLAAMR